MGTWNSLASADFQPKVPDKWRWVTRAMGELLGEGNPEDRLDEIRDNIKRMDTCWDDGYYLDEQEELE